MKMTNKIYDVLKYIALIVLPAIGTLYFDVAADAEGELPVQLVPGQGLAKIECLQYSESKNGLKKFYLDPEVTNGAVIIDDDVTTPADTTVTTTKASTTDTTTTCLLYTSPSPRDA